jgi:hypothetical protein
MLFQRINRSDPEKIYIVVKNIYSTAALALGQSVQFDIASAKDGVSVTRPSARATSAGFNYAGVAAETIGVNGYGLIQVFGYFPSANVRCTSGLKGSKPVVAGRPLCPNAAGSVFCLENMDTKSKNITYACVGFALGGNASWTTKQIPIFINAM